MGVELAPAPIGGACCEVRAIEADRAASKVRDDERHVAGRVYECEVIVGRGVEGGARVCMDLGSNRLGSVGKIEPKFIYPNRIHLITAGRSGVPRMKDLLDSAGCRQWTGPEHDALPPRFANSLW